MSADWPTGLWRWVYHRWGGWVWHLTDDGLVTFCTANIPDESETKGLGGWVPSRALRCDVCVAAAADRLGL
jgi:hypothetical protein